MKKELVIASLAFCGAVLVATNVTSYAAQGDGTTNGYVQFKAPGPGDKGTIIKPDTPDEVIEMETGNYTTGDLRLTHVPDFDFGVVNLASEKFSAKAKFEEYRKAGTTDPKTPIAHFAQIEDLRGKKTEGWSLTLKASKFKPSKAENSDLEDSVIILKEGQLFNTRLNATELATAVQPFVKGTKLTPDVAQPLVRTESGQNTTASKTSLVFNDKYTKDDTVGGETDGLNPGVVIDVASSDEKLVDEKYTAVLTWTLEIAF